MSSHGRAWWRSISVSPKRRRRTLVSDSPAFMLKLLPMPFLHGNFCVPRCHVTKAHAAQRLPSAAKRVASITLHVLVMHRLSLRICFPLSKFVLLCLGLPMVRLTLALSLYGIGSFLIRDNTRLVYYPFLLPSCFFARKVALTSVKALQYGAALGNRVVVRMVSAIRGLWRSLREWRD